MENQGRETDGGKHGKEDEDFDTWRWEDIEVMITRDVLSSMITIDVHHTDQYHEVLSSKITTMDSALFPLLRRVPSLRCSCSVL